MESCCDGRPEGTRKCWWSGGLPVILTVFQSHSFLTWDLTIHLQAGYPFWGKVTCLPFTVQEEWHLMTSAFVLMSLGTEGRKEAMVLLGRGLLASYCNAGPWGLTCPGSG